MNAAVRPDSDSGHRVGPNAIIQTRAALQDACDASMVARIFRDAGLGRWANADPDGMVPADSVNALNRAVALALDAGTAEAVMREAGRRTGDYILANRIPKLAQRLLRLMPGPLARRMLLKAIAKNAWTFAGSADIRTGADFIEILANPACLGRQGFEGCVWHEAVLERLFRALADPRAVVIETRCTGRGDPACRFEIRRQRLSAR